MNFFQQQLKWILGNQPEFQDAKYVGRACFVPLVDGTRIKAELITHARKIRSAEADGHEQGGRSDRRHNPGI